MHKLLTLLLTLLTCAAYSQQYCHVAGTVTDARHEAVSYAIISVNGNKYHSNIDGLYQVDVPRGTYTFSGAALGYELQKKRNVSCNKDTLILDFALIDASKQLSEVTVTSPNDNNVQLEEASFYSKKRRELYGKNKAEETVSMEVIRDKGDTKIEQTITADHIKNSPAQPVDDVGLITGGPTHIIDNSQSVEVYTNKSLKGHRMMNNNSTMASTGLGDIKPAPPKPKPTAAELAQAPRPKAGTLTSGEINDFSKWKLWSDLQYGEFDQYSKQWGFYPRHRYMVEVTNEAGFPVSGATAILYDHRGNESWRARTDNTGKAELWPDMFEYDTTRIPEYSIKAEYQGVYKTISGVAQFPNGNNRIVLATDCGTSDDVDIVFTVDATGSMGDEISYLKTELLDVIRRAQENNHKLNINVGSVFYRDKDDDYLTKISPLDENINRTYDFIKDQSAAGGGDFPEAVDEALDVTIRKIEWHNDARAKIVFLILDAPPHDDMSTRSRLSHLMKEAAEKGIRIVPLACSGVDKSTEYIMRAMAMATNGTYTFLTDHSGVGGEHIKPSTDSYKVEKMNDLVMRLILQYSYYPDCKDYLTERKKDEKDILAKTNQDFISTDSAQVKTDVLNDPMSEDEFAANVKIFPNPTHGPLTLEVTGDISELYLTDITGKVLERYPTSKGDKVKIDVKENAAGIYFIRYMRNEHWKGGKIVLLKS